MPELSTVRFEEFEIGKLFKSQNGNFDIKKEHINGNGIHVITAGVDNYGILGNTDVDACVISKDTITVDMFGNVFYRPFEYKMVIHARVFSLEPISFKLGEGVGLYIATCLKWLTQRFSYSDMCSYKKIKDMKIYLPILDIIDTTCKYHKDGYIPDFEYMERYIAELEQERIAELEQERIAEIEQYLIATGLNDYTLTDEDKAALSLLETRDNEVRHNADNVTVPKQVRHFRCGDLFEIHPTKAYKLSNHDLYKVEGNNRIISNTSVNNGIGGYSGLDNTEQGGIITFSDTTIGVDTMYYQPDAFIGYAHVQGMYPKDRKNWKEQQLKYFIAVMRSACGTGWSYANKFNRKLVANMLPELPIQTDENNNPIIDTTYKYHKDGYIPDWSFMERYIKAMEKVVIADVVKYKDGVIAQTKSIVGI